MKKLSTLDTIVLVGMIVQNVSACTVCESSPTFKTIRGAIMWLSRRGYKPTNNNLTDIKI